jgi:Tfp pilus assembly protein PilF
MRSRWLAGLVLVAAGCTPTMQDRVRAYNADALYLFQHGDYPHARDTFQAALDLTPEDADLRFNIAQCYERMGNQDKAESTYCECVQKAPNHAESRHALCVLMVRQKRREEAVRMVEDWLRRQPRLSAPYAEDGWLWHQAGDLPRALSRLEQALQFDPQNTRAIVEMALVYEELGYPDRALVLYDRSLDFNPNQPDVLQRVNRMRSQGVKYPRPE